MAEDGKTIAQLLLSITIEAADFLAERPTGPSPFSPRMEHCLGHCALARDSTPSG